MIHDIRGARARIDNPEEVLRRVASWGAERDREILVADARAVFGRDHLESAVRHAERAQDQRRMSARGLAMETLLYLSGRRQVSDALEVAGIRAGTRAVAVVTFGDTLAPDLVEAMGWTSDPRVLEATGKDPALLRLGSAELGTIEKERWMELALERVALLDVEK